MQFASPRTHVAAEILIGQQALDGLAYFLRRRGVHAQAALALFDDFRHSGAAVGELGQAQRHILKALVDGTG